MKPDKVDATLAKRREKDARIVAAGKESSVQASKPERLREHNKSPEMHTAKNDAEELSEQLTERDQLFYQAGLASGERRKLSHSERGAFSRELSKTGVRSDPENSDRQGLEWRREGGVERQRHADPYAVNQAHGGRQ